jgi:hypothetical protein
MPTRGGTRGGREMFKWEEVKTDKHREVSRMRVVVLDMAPMSPESEC